VEVGGTTARDGHRGLTSARPGIEPGDDPAGPVAHAARAVPPVVDEGAEPGAARAAFASPAIRPDFGRHELVVVDMEQLDGAALGDVLDADDQAR